MPNVLAPAFALPAKSFPGTQGAASGIAGELLATDILPRYSTLCKLGKLQFAYATLSASSPTIYTTNTLTGGPFLWNPPGSGVDAHILAMTVTNTTVPSTGTAGAFGITYGPQNAAPTATTAIDASGNMLAGGPSSALTVYRTATPAAAGTSFVATYQCGLTAVSAQFVPAWVEMGGIIILPPGNFLALAGSSTMTNGVFKAGLLWAEFPT